MINELSKDEIKAFGNLTYLAEIIKNILFCISVLIFSKYPIEKVKEKKDSIPYLDMI